MAQRVGQKVKLSSIDELLGVPSTEGTVDLDVMTIYPFENHPFRVVDDEKMEELVESIKEMTNDDATIAMVNANMQREEILPSEKAFAYKMKLDAIRSQGKRRDLTSVQVEQKLNGKTLREQIAEDMGTRAVQVSRFIRLTELIPKLLDMVDEKRLALSVAVEIYYFTKTYQQWIWEYIHENGMIKQEQLMVLRQYRDDDSLTQEQMLEERFGKRTTYDYTVAVGE